MELMEIKFRETNEILKGKNENEDDIINQYLVMKDLGEGAFSEVKLLKDLNTGEHFAAKILNKRELEKKKKGIKRADDGSVIVDNFLKDALREIAILKRLNCENIIKLHEIMHDDEEGKIYLVMEFADKGQILTFNEETATFEVNPEFVKDKNTSRYNMEQIKDFIRGIVKGLHYCNIYIYNFSA